MDISIRYDETDNYDDHDRDNFDDDKGSMV